MILSNIPTDELQKMKIFFQNSPKNSDVSDMSDSENTEIVKKIEKKILKNENNKTEKFEKNKITKSKKNDSEEIEKIKFDKKQKLIEQLKKAREIKKKNLEKKKIEFEKNKIEQNKKLKNIFIENKKIENENEIKNDAPNDLKFITHIPNKKTMEFHNTINNGKRKIKKYIMDIFGFNLKEDGLINYIKIVFENHLNKLSVNREDIKKNINFEKIFPIDPYEHIKIHHKVEDCLNFVIEFEKIYPDSVVYALELINLNMHFLKNKI